MEPLPQAANQREQTHRSAAYRRLATFVSGTLIALTLLGYFIYRWDLREARAFNAAQPLVSLSPPLRSQPSGNDHLWMLTRWTQKVAAPSQRRFTGDPTTRTETYIELWQLDANQMQPRQRLRLRTYRSAGTVDFSDHQLLGVDGATLWLILDNQPIALSTQDGRALLTAADLERRNPVLAGNLLREARYYTMDGGGMVVLDAQARHWRINAGDFSATPASQVPSRRQDVWLPAKDTAGQELSYSQVRGIDAGQRWLGVLSDDEARALSERHGSSGRAFDRIKQGLAADALMRGTPPHGTRARVWQARIREVTAAPADWPDTMPDNWGKRRQYYDLAPLPHSPAFLDGGLMATSKYPPAPIWLRRPDGVLVSYRQRLGRDGRIGLARIDSPSGKAAWDVSLPLTTLQHALPGERSLVLWGRHFQPQPRAQDGLSSTESSNDETEMLLAVDVATGDVRALPFDGDVRRRQHSRPIGLQ